MYYGQKVACYVELSVEEGIYTVKCVYYSQEMDKVLTSEAFTVELFTMVPQIPTYSLLTPICHKAK